jgi:hypothetical protein
MSLLKPLFGFIASTDALATLARLLGYAGWGSTGFVLRSGLAGTLVIHLRQPHVLAQSYVFVGALPLFVPEGALRPSKLGGHLLERGVKGRIDVRVFRLGAPHSERAHLHGHGAAIGRSLPREVNGGGIEPSEVLARDPKDALPGMRGQRGSKVDV